jgi:multimeric flavodoxin WrbA
MNLLLISSSPRKLKSQTFQLALSMLEGHDSSVKTDVIHLCDYSIEFCRHCERCHKKILACPIKDDILPIIDKMLNADGIVLASPNYINHITASMKALFERASHFIHCKRLLGKYIAGAVSSGSGNDADVLAYLRHCSLTCGAYYVGGVSARSPVGPGKKVEALLLGKDLVKAIRQKKHYPKQKKEIEASIEYFKALIEKRKDSWSGEYIYWKKFRR